MTDERVKRIAEKANRIVSMILPFAEDIAAIYAAVEYMEQTAPRASKRAKEMLKEEDMNREKMTFDEFVALSEARARKALKSLYAMDEDGDAIYNNDVVASASAYTVCKFIKDENPETWEALRAGLKILIG